MIAVVTDSAASLPREVVDELGIRVVPLYLRFGDRSLRDGVEVEDFYERLAAFDGPVTTAAPSVGDFADAFASTGADRIVCVTVAASVSAVHQAASVAARESPARVEVVDSGAASMAQGFVAMAAARASSFEEAVAAAHATARRSSLVAAIDTFTYLRRSGRVRALQAFAATALDLKPVFRMRAGEIQPLARPRTRRRALRRVAEAVLADVAGPVRIAAFHADAEHDARALLERVTAELDVVESYGVEFTPAMGAHTGPGVVGLAYVPA